MTASDVKAALAAFADPEKEAFYPRFFRTGKGEYGEGDQFIGVVVPNQRKVARKHRTLRLAEVDRLLQSPVHEHRLTGLLIHKAVGWMLREVSKQDMTVLEDFLRPRYARMPRTMLRYAIERMEPERRQAYLKGHAR